MGERSCLVNSAEKTAARHVVMRARLGKHKILMKVVRFPRNVLNQPCKNNKRARSNR